MTSSVARQSAAAATDRLGAFAAGADPGEIASVAEEILAVAELLRSEPRLRRALVDNSRSGTDRTGLLRSLLENRVGTQALDLLVTLVAGRWSVPGELLSAMERLGVDALLSAADRAGDLAEVEDELFRFGQIVAGDPHLASAIGDTSAEVSRRERLVSDLLAGKARAATLRLATLSLAGIGGRGFAGTLRWLVELAAERRERDIAYVTVATDLSAADEQRLSALLAERYGREVSLKVTIDPRVIGGVRVQVGSDLYDGTVHRRLATARAAMTK